MGRGWFDFRTGIQREQDYRDFTERVFSGGLPHKKRVRERLQQEIGKKDVTYEFVYYTALKDRMVRNPKLTFDQGLKQVCGEIHVMKLDQKTIQAIRQVLELDLEEKI